MINFEDCFVGRQWQGQTFTLVEEDIINFSKQWDPQIFHTDKELAKNSYYGGITAPSAYLFAITSKLFNNIDQYNAIRGMESRFNIPIPAFSGDILTFHLSCLAKRISLSKSDRGIIEFALKLINQHKKVTFDGISTVMMYS